MILPHASDHLVSGFSASIGRENVQRVVILRRPHPGRQDTYIMVHELDMEGQPYHAWYTPLEEDLTDRLEVSLFNRGLVSYPLMRFEGEPTLPEAVRMGKRDKRVRFVVENVLGMDIDDLAEAVRWKP